MENQELDGQVARAIGLEVVGKVRCQFIDGRWLMHHKYHWDGSELPLRLVYVNECVCDRVAPGSHGHLCGHRAMCLDVVPLYSESIAEAWTLKKILYNEGWRITLMDENDADTFSVEATLHKCPECHRGDGHALAYARGFDDYPRAICEVFLETRKQARHNSPCVAPSPMV